MNIIYFGKIAAIANATSEEVSLPENTITALVTYLTEKYQLDMSDMQIAVNHNLVDVQKEILLKETDEVAILSAFAGG
ncbi:MoaD/ThiS family protein [Tenacibaculum amylolyticum]|uniref:MoaD/ThiS family protein n=1 Tax=Tenacibaculum amylolyticum TaxID=104269 RepID=UPI0038930273